MHCFLRRDNWKVINVCNKLSYGTALYTSGDFYYLFIFRLSRSTKQNMLNNKKQPHENKQKCLVFSFHLNEHAILKSCEVYLMQQAFEYPYNKKNSNSLTRPCSAERQYIVLCLIPEVTHQGTELLLGMVRLHTAGVESHSRQPRDLGSCPIQVSWPTPNISKNN